MKHLKPICTVTIKRHLMLSYTFRHISLNTRSLTAADIPVVGWLLFGTVAVERFAVYGAALVRQPHEEGFELEEHRPLVHPLMAAWESVEH